MTASASTPPAIIARFRVAWPGFTLDVDLQWPGRGVTALFGPSGSGKTSLLRCVAGLERATRGYLAVNGQVWQDDARRLFMPTHRRPLGYVFQEASLFPHLSVRRNLEFGLKRTPVAERQVGLEQIITLLGIGPLLDRRPAHLSGGERQRVAIARALAASPRLLLMDEPLAALDLKRKGEILPYLERLHSELDIPVLYVSHSPDEVARLADHVVYLEAGQARAVGPLNEILTRPDLPLVHLDEASAVLDARVAGHDEVYHLTEVNIPGGRLAVSHSALPVGAPTRVRIHARDVSLALQPPERSSIQNVLSANVLDVQGDRDPAQALVRLDLGEGAILLARITQRSVAHLGITPGMKVYAQVKSVALMD
ncbi:MAG: modC [Proteobacteria bacterium]|nr:modC [Pseudomonadota bacterium]